MPPADIRTPPRHGRALILPNQSILNWNLNVEVSLRKGASYDTWRAYPSGYPPGGDRQCDEEVDQIKGCVRVISDYFQLEKSSVVVTCHSQHWPIRIRLQLFPVPDWWTASLQNQFRQLLQTSRHFDVVVPRRRPAAQRSNRRRKQGIKVVDKAA